MKKYIKITGRVILSFIAFLLVLLLLVQLSSVQSWLAKKAADKLSKQLQTEVRINNVSFSLFDKFDFNGFLIRDQHKDTLLYAGTFRVRITDWFFLQKKAELKYIGLEDASINLKRTKATWNYQFIIDKLSSSDTSHSSDAGIYFNLKKVDLENVTFIQNDGWVGEKMTAHVDALLLDAEKVDFIKGRYAINNLRLEQPRFELYEYDGTRPDSVRQRQLREEKPTALRFNPGILLRIDSLKIHNGVFMLDSDDDLPAAHFDGTHIKLSQINGSFRNVHFDKDTLRSNINLACKDRCGFELKKLKANLRITPEIIELAKLDIVTPRSHLGDYYAMRFKHFNNDFKDYITKVVMDGKIRDSKVSSDDIAYFAPDLKPWKKEAYISGNFLGTVANFDVKNLFIRSGGTSDVQGNLSIKGIPDVDKMVINFPNGTIKTNSTDIKTFIPAVKDLDAVNLDALGTILFRGSFNGTIYDFKTNGVLSSNIGAVNADAAMKFPENGEAIYSGDLLTNRFNLGKFVNSTQLGLVDFQGKITGSSFNLSKINTSINGTFNNLEFNGYNYTNITTDATLIKNLFKGDVKIDDPNLDFTSTIETNLSKTDASINVLGDLHTCNFKNLKLTHENIELTGLLDMNFKGNDIDNFVGTAKILNASLLHENNKLSFDSLVLSTGKNGSGEHTLSLQSNEFTLLIAGKSYKLLDLPTAYQTYMSHYFPSYFIAPTTPPVKQDFRAILYTRDFNDYLKIIDKRLSGLDYATISGSINTNSNRFSILADVPTLTFDKYRFTDASITSEGTLDSLKLNGDITNIRIGDSLNFPNTSIAVVSSNDHSDLQLNTKADNTLNEANFNAAITTLEDGVKINFKPSYFVLNDKKWNLENTGQIEIRRNIVSADNVKFTQGLQEIKVETESDNSESATDNLTLKLKNVVLGDITSLFVKDPQFEGLANGEVKLKDFYGNFNAAANIKAEQFRMDADSIGVLNLAADYDNKSGIVNFKASSPNKSYKLNSQGHYNTKDSTGQALYISTDLEDAKAGFVQRFLGDIFSDMTGNVTGNLIVQGDPNSPQLLGKVTLRNAGLKVIYTQVYYSIDSATISFDEDGINFGELVIKDRFKNKGTVKGKLYEKGFKDMNFDFTLNTPKLLLIDTKLKDNKLFYGRAIGKASMSFKGPEKKTYLKMVAEANDSSHLYIPNSINKESGSADFIVFKKYGTEVQSEGTKSDFDLTVDLDLTANKYVGIDVILDDQSGDVIKAVGNGRLKIIAGTSAPFTMKGRYNIDQGSYDFSFQSFIKKPFILLPNAGNYIEWTGNPSNAEIHIDAQYIADRVSVGDLLSSQQAAVNSSTKSYRGQVFVIASLREQLIKPQITFKLDFPQSSPVKTDPVFMEFVNRIESDQNEMLSQATSLIVFGSFAPYGQGLLAGNGATINSLGVNTISQLLTKQVNKAVSNLLYKLTGDRGLQFDLGTSVYSSSSILDQSSGLTATSSSSHLDRTNVNFKIGKSFFNDNVIVSFGGDLDFSAPGSTSTIANGNFQWLPDLNIELILSKDKRLRGIVFNKNSLDISGSTLGRVNRQGVSLSYKLDFDHLLGIKSKEVRIPLRQSADEDFIQ